MGTHPIFESDFDCLTEKMGIGNDLMLQEVRGKMDDQFQRDIGLMRSACSLNTRARRSYDTCHMVSEMIKRDHENLIDLRSDLKKMNNQLDNLLLSDSFMKMEEMYAGCKKQSKWDNAIENLNIEIEIKTGKSVEKLAKMYRIREPKN